MIFCIIANVEFWPFSGYAVFKSARSFEQLNVVRLGLSNEDGTWRWLYLGTAVGQNKILWVRVSHVRGRDNAGILKLMKNHLPRARRVAGGRYSHLVLYRIRADRSHLRNTAVEPYLSIPLHDISQNE